MVFLQIKALSLLLPGSDQYVLVPSERNLNSHKAHEAIKRTSEKEAHEGLQS